MRGEGLPGSRKALTPTKTLSQDEKATRSAKLVGTCGVQRLPNAYLDLAGLGFLSFG
jgi:hypothetical protein